MQYVKQKLVIKNTRTCHHTMNDDTQVPLKCSRAGKQAVNRHSAWLELKASVVGGVCRIKPQKWQEIVTFCIL
jgi:S-methylmethionine-dependent homocysteine/selenocysteine methylase